MKTKSWFSLLILGVVLTGSAACKGGDSPTGPQPPATRLTFRGTIASGGSPLAGITVYLSGDETKSTATDASGTYSFADVSGKSFVVTPSNKNYTFSPSNYEVGAQSRADLNFTAALATYGSLVGQIAADFTAVDQNGQPVSLYSYFGKVVLIDFSADWCGPCRDEATKAEALYQKYKAGGLEMLTILIDGSPGTWAATYGLTFHVLNDDAEVLWAIYGEGYIPLNIVLDRNMTIRYKKAGYVESEVEAAIQKYL